VIFSNRSLFSPLVKINGVPAKIIFTAMHDSASKPYPYPYEHLHHRRLAVDGYIAYH
jgi:hypothetical protein